MTFILGVVFGAHEACAAEAACPSKMFRWEEDCSKLRSESASLSALDRLRFIPLNRAGSVWLTLGAQYRT